MKTAMKKDAGIRIRLSVSMKYSFMDAMIFCTCKNFPVLLANMTFQKLKSFF
jgi:hypothetical protein